MAGEGLTGLRDAQTAVDRGTAEDLPPTRNVGGVPDPEGSLAPAVEGDERANYQYDKVTRDSRGEPIRELPFAENAKTGWEKLDKQLEELNAEGDGDYQAIGYDEVIKREAQREYPGNRARQAEFIKEKAAVVSASRQVASARIQEGQDPLEYLSSFRAIEGPPSITQDGASVGGKVPGDLKLTEEDLTTSVGEIRGDDGFPITDGRSLGKERTRRQILRTVNKDTLNQGLNEGSDIVLEPKTKDNKGKVLNAVSLTTKMRDRVPGDENASMAAKAGQWFTAGIGSLQEAGHTVDLATIPGETVILKQGKKAITWEQARQAMGNAPQKGLPGNIVRLEGVSTALGKMKGKLTEAQATRLNKDLGFSGTEIQVAPGDSVTAARKLINAEAVKARRAETEFEFDPDTQDKTGIPEAGDKPMRPLKRDTPATGKRVAIGVKPKTILNKDGFQKLERAGNAAKGSIRQTGWQVASKRDRQAAF